MIAGDPKISVTPASLEFGSVSLFGSVTKPVAVSNVGKSNLTVNSVTISGIDARNFSKESGCGTVAPNGTCTINVTYRRGSLSPALKSTVLTISSNDPGRPAVAVALSAQNRDHNTCDYAISPASGSFSSSAAAGSISVIAPSGCTWTAASNASWMSLAPESRNGSGNGTVNYSVGPNATASSRTGTITVACQRFTITQATSAFPVISVSPNSLDFGAIHRRTLAIKTVTVSNAGGANLTVSSAALSGTNANQFTKTTNCGTVAPNGSCTVTVTFRPTSSGNTSANLYLRSNDPVTPQTGVALYGTGR